MACHGDAAHQQVLKGLQKPEGKQTPFSLLYDKNGSELYKEITRLEEYYPFLAEDKMLELHVDEIAARIPPQSLIVELGCGTACKTAKILSAIQAHHGRCRFAGIDVSGPFLEEACKNLIQEVDGLRLEDMDMVEADYMVGLKTIRERYPDENICILWLGSSVGNLSAADAVQFFQDAIAAIGTHCQIFLCTDMWKDQEVLRTAYHDKQGITALFIKNGMRNALALLGHEVSPDDEASWVYEVDINEHLRQVEMFIKFPVELTLPQHQIHIRAGERVLVEMSRKFTVGDINFLANESGFIIDKTWRDQTWGMQMLVPFKEAFVRCWNMTDAFFENLPNWTEKPIDIRHPFCFYYGHMSAFAKLKLLPNELATKLDLMFSRGIDPTVTDPSKCHSHPEVPVQWPMKEEIIEYVHHVRLLLANAMEDKDCISARLINMGLEHEYMHLETLTYMLVQQQKKRFEKKKSSNGFNTLSYTNGHINNSHVGNGSGSTSTSSGPTTKPSETPMRSYPSSGTMVQISKGNVTMGGNVADDAFMWDNEYPQLTTFVSDTFVVSSEPVTVRDFLAFVKEGGYEHEELWHPVDFKFFKEQGHKHPATWSKVQDEYYVHCPNLTTHHWSKVADQPVLVSLSEAEAFCSSVGCRVMTEAEYHKILQSGGYAPKVHKLRTDGWEWTSSPFQPFPGFKPMDEYPEYSNDFFDGSHYVLKGASSVTHPIMQRDSFRNFYQRQYPYVFAKFRCCKSMPCNFRPFCEDDSIV